MDQESTSFQQENTRLSIIVDKLLELFPDPCLDFKNNPSQFEELEIQQGVYLGMNEVSEPEGPWLQKRQELDELLLQEVSDPIKSMFPNQNITRGSIIRSIYAKLYKSLVIGKYKFEPKAEDRKQEEYRQFLIQTQAFLKKFDNGKLSPGNLIIWTSIFINIDPASMVDTECGDKMANYMDTIQHYSQFQEQVGQQIMNQLEQLVGQINNSPVLEQIYGEFSQKLGIPCGQQLIYAFKFCKLHYIHDPRILGLTLMDGTIILNLFQITLLIKQIEQISEIKMQTLTAFYLIVLLHESAHFFLRKQFNEYEINNSEKVKKVNPNSNNTESGVLLENILMPPIIEGYMKGIPKINDLMAKFLLNVDNWKLPLNEFQQKLQVLSQTKEDTISIQLAKGSHTNSKCIYFSQYCPQPRSKARNIA